jgi:hypothetical protein
LETVACRAIALEARQLSESGRREESIQLFESAYRIYGDIWLLHCSANEYYRLAKGTLDPRSQIIYWQESLERFQQLRQHPNAEKEAVQDAEQAILTIHVKMAEARSQPATRPGAPAIEPIYRRWRFWVGIVGVTGALGLGLGLGLGLDRYRHSQNVGGVPIYF